MKKKFLTLLGGTLLGLVCTSAWAQKTNGDEFVYESKRYKVASDNLWTNGSFADGVDGWKTVNYSTAAVASNFTLSSTGGWDGGQYITTSGEGTGSAKTIRQSVAVENGKTYYFCVYTSGKAPASNNFNYNALFKMTNASTENGVIKAFAWPQGAEKTTTDWNITECIFTASTSYVGVRMGWNSSSSFDGFGLYEITDLGADKATLQELISEAGNLHSDAGIGEADLQSAIDDASKVDENSNATVEQVKNAETALKAAILKYGMANASKDNPFDIRYKIGDIAGSTSNWSFPNGVQNKVYKASTEKNTDVYKATGFIENWNSSNFKGEISYTINNLPAGRYKVSALAFDDKKSGNVYFIAGDKEVVLGNTTTKFTNPTIDDVVLLEENSSLKVGLKITDASTNWVGIANVKLEYKGAQDILFNAIDFADPCTVETWYKKAITIVGEYSISSSADATVYYTQNGDQTDAEVTTSVSLTADTPETLELEAGTLYLKSSVEATITIAPKSFDYELGDYTCNPKNGAYIQNDLISVTFPNAATNDPDATLALANGAKATVGTEEIALTAIANGFQFNIGELAKGTEYTVNIPEGVFGYTDHKMNEAIALTFHTPEIFDGVYYVYSPVTEKFTSRGNAYNTAVIVDEYGIAMRLVTDEDNSTTFNLVDANTYWGLNDWMYTDKTGNDTGHYTISSIDGGYTILNKANDKNVYVCLTDDANKFRVAGNAIKADNYTDDAQIVWQFKTPAEHASIMSDYKDTQASAAATAASIENVTTKDALETEVAEYAQTDITITTPSSVEESFKFGKGVDVYTQSASGLKPGLYKLTVEAFTRLNDFDNTNVAKQGGYAGTTSYIYANDAKTQICSVMDEPATTGGDGWWSKDGSYYPNNVTAAGQAFDNGSYKNEVWVYVAADAGEETGTLTYGIKEPGKCTNNNWLCYRKFTLTYYSNNKADADDYAALADAIADAEEYTLGFEAGEYAPYNNVNALTALAAAKAIDTTVSNEKDVVETATDALTNATWTPNTEEVNAVYDGSFNLTTKTEGDYTVPTGWTNVGYNTRVYNSLNMGSNAGVSATSKTATMFAKFTTEYGTEAGYTMPLKAGVYYLSFIYGGWNEKGARDIKVYKTDDNTISATVTPSSVTAKDTKAHTTTSSWSTYSGLVEIPEDGDYILSFYRENTTSQNQICISDIELKKAASANMTITDVKWGTFVAPFDVAIPEGVEAYTVTGVDKNTGVISMASVETTIEANTPVLVYSESAQNETFYGKAVSGDPASDYLVGVYEPAKAPAGSYILMLHNGKAVFGQVVEGKEPTVGANRCYLNVPGGASSTILRFGDATGIQSMEQEDETVIYDLTGRRVDAAVKGIYIVGGKKMLVK